MWSRATARRGVTATAIAVACAAAAAATASAKVVPVVDDFSGGTATDTVVRNGSVELARTLEEQFTGVELPTGWMSTPWATGGATTVVGDALLIDGARADSRVAGGPGSSLEFRATFGSEQYQHVGFGTDFNAPPWAMFSTGSDGGGKLYARTSDVAGPLADQEYLVSIDLTVAHYYRIDWTPTGFDYYVDGTKVVTHDVPLTAAMSAQGSDLNVGSGGVSIDSIVLNTHKTSGTYVSHTLDAGDARVTGISFTPSDEQPAGTSITYATRTADTATGFSGDWEPLGPNGAVASPKRYLQYRATLDTTQAATTPRINKVEANFTVDDEPPALAIDGVAVSGSTARVAFQAEAGATVECKLDSAPFAACTSPAEFGGLADGPHTIAVRATDSVGNAADASRAFAVDTTAPEVTIRDVSVSGGTATVTFGSNEQAVFACTLDGAAFESCASPAVLSGLAAGSHTVVVRATDPHGNAGSATRTFAIASPSAPPPSGGNPGTSADVSAPNVRVTPRSVRVSKSGYAKVRVKCPATEATCKVTLKLKLSGKRIARKTITVPGGQKRTLRLRLSRAARAKLAARARLNVKAVVTASDAAANRTTKRFRLTLRAPSA